MGKRNNCPFALIVGLLVVVLDIIVVCIFLRSYRILFCADYCWLLLAVGAGVFCYCVTRKLCKHSLKQRKE